MRGSMRAATAIGIGYVLGRRRKFRTAVMMASGMTTGGGIVGSLLVKRGLKVVRSTGALEQLAPQLRDIAEIVRGELLTAGKSAASAALSNRVDSLSDSLRERAERLRNPADGAESGADDDYDADDDYEDTDDYEDDGAEEAEPESVRRPAARRSPVTRAKG